MERKLFIVIIFSALVIVAFIFGMNRGKQIYPSNSLAEYLVELAEKFDNPPMEQIERTTFSICIFFKPQQAIGYTNDDRIIPVTLGSDEGYCIES